MKEFMLTIALMALISYSAMLLVLFAMKLILRS